MRVDGFYRFATDHPDRPAIVAADAATTSFGELLALSRGWARALAARGVAEGETVGLLAGNEPVFLAGCLAALESGLTLVPLSPRATPADLAGVIEARGIRVVAASASRSALAEAAGVPRRDVVTGPATDGEALPRRAGQIVAPASPPPPLPATDPDAAASAAGIMSLLLDLEPQGVHLVCGPLVHPDVRRIALSCLHAGHTLWLRDSWSPAAALASLRGGATSTYLLGSHLASLAEHVAGLPAAPALGDVVLVHGSPCPPATPRSLRSRLYRWEPGPPASLVKPEPRRGSRGHVGWYRRAEALPDEPAVVDTDGRVLSSGELLGQVTAWRSTLAAAGLRAGDVVMLVADNGALFVAVLLAAMESGLYVVPFNPRGTGQEAAYVARGSGAALVVTDPRHVRLARSAGLADDRVLTEPSGDRSVPLPRRSGQLLPFTSGTTGRPKGVLRPPPALDPDTAACHLATSSVLYGLPPAGRHLVAGTLSHVAFLTSALAALHAGQALVLLPAWSARAALDAMHAHRVTSVFLVPTMLNSLVELVEAGAPPPPDLSVLVHGAAPCPPELKWRARECFGPVLVEIYASVEAAGTYVLPDEWAARPGTVGRPFPGAAVTVRRDDGDAAAPGEIGDVLLAYDGFRYTGAAAPSARSPYVSVGDVGYLDDAGWLYLVDRAADIVNVGGTNVYASEVESVLRSHPEVLDAAVVGVPHRRFGQRARALVQVRAGAVPADVEAALRERCRTDLTYAKRPDRIVLTSGPLPRSPIGKLDRTAVAAVVAEPPS